MSHPFGDCLSLYLHRKHGLSQSKLAAGILQDPSIITEMCKGKRLTGRQARERVLAIIGWLFQQGALEYVEEANALLEAAGMTALRGNESGEALLLRHLDGAMLRKPTFALTPIRRTQLPARPTAFIGRTQELQDIIQCITGSACRLLNLVGVGGIGKTRLAIEAANAVSDQFPNGVFWVNLEPIQTADLLIGAIADALAFPLAGQSDPEAQLHRYLHNKALLLVLDNFEQLLPAADRLVGILHETSAVKLLVTSREVINLREEWLYPLDGLAFPRPEQMQKDSAQWANIENYSAVQLFVERARQLQPAFAPASNFESIVHICQVTEGIPLALELAASWIKTLACHEIAAEIDNGLAILSTRLRNLPERHRTMHAVFDQSWRRLGADEQRLFQRLSVFRGGFRREAAQQVAGATLPMLAMLVDHSLLKQDGDGRYQIHELLRQYGEERMSESAVDRLALQERHALHYTEFLNNLLSQLIGGDELGSLAVSRPELGNLRVAWHWAIAHEKTDAIRKSAAALHWMCQLQSRFLDGFTMLTEAERHLSSIAEGDNIAAALLELWLYGAWLTLRLGRLEEAEAAVNQCLQLEATHHLAPLPSWANNPLLILSLIRIIRGDSARAEQLAHDIYHADRAQAQVWNLPCACFALAQAQLAQGKMEEARQAATEAVQLCQQYGMQWFLAYCLNTLGEIALLRGDNGAARQHYQAAYAIRQQFGDPEGMGVALNHLGEVALREAKPAAAQAHFEASLALYAEINDLGGLATVHKGLGQVAFLHGDFDRARQHYQQALQIAVSIDYTSLLVALLIRSSELLLHHFADPSARSVLAFVCQSPQSDYSSKSSASSLLEQSGQSLSVCSPLADRRDEMVVETVESLEQAIALIQNAFIRHSHSPSAV